MRSLFRFTAALLLLAASALPAKAEERLLTIGISQAPSTLNPLHSPLRVKSYLHGFTRRPFTAYGADWELGCLVCTNLPSLEAGTAEVVDLEDGSKGMLTEWEIKPGLVWGNGTPVTSADVAFAHQVGTSEEAKIDSIETWKRILKVEILDERRFRLLGDRIDYRYDALGLPLMPAHLEKELFEENPAAYLERTLFDNDPTNPGLHFGPYLLSGIEKGSSYSFTPNPHWAGKAPYFERIVVRVIENTAALQANLLSGAIDMVAGELGMTVDQAMELARSHGDDYQVLFEAGLIYEHLEVNHDHPALADKRVRQALLLAIDREAINASLFGGEQPPADSNVSPLDSVALEELKHYPHDPEAAAALLDEAGWTLSSDGLRRNAGGETLSFEYMTTAGARHRELVQQVIQQGWRALGIEATIRNQPARVLFGETVAKRQFGGIVQFAWISAPEAVPFTTLHSSQIPSEENGWAGQNAGGYANPEMDRLIDAIEVELGREARKALWADLQRLYSEELPAIPLYWRADAFVLPQGMTGLVPTGNLDSTSMWAEDWRLGD